MIKRLKKVSSLILGVVLMMSMMNVYPINAQTNTDKYTLKEINAEEYGLPTLKDKKVNEAFLTSFDGNPKDIVKVIVELEEAPIIEQEKVSTFSRMSLNTQSEDLIEKQDEVIHEIEKIDDTVTVNEQFTYLSNSIALDIKAESFDKIKEMPEVKRIFVEKVYHIPTPQMTSSNEIVQSPSIWTDHGYSGEGMKIAILDTGLDTSHPAFSTDPQNPAYNQASIDARLEEVKADVNAQISDFRKAYASAKVPFTYDYTKRDVNVNPVSTDPEEVAAVEHGTHVAGIAAGNNKTYLDQGNAGEVFKGVAPEAQLLIFKVFDDTGMGATDSIILSALEDAVLLNVDSINMSLGSDAGFSDDGGAFSEEVYKRIQDAGILISASSGNAHSNTKNNIWGTDLALAEDPDHGIAGSPSIYNGPLAIASSDNAFVTSNIFEVGSERITYVDTDTHTLTKITGEHDFVVIPGVGDFDDYNDMDVSGKVVFVSRGEISFADKMTVAEANAAAAIIVYGTTDELIHMDTTETYAELPTAYITKTNAEKIFATGETKINLTHEEVTAPNPSANLTSPFSSLGTTLDLNIKPEITAPGGTIYSALPTQGTDEYGYRSGTSMSAPHVAGGAVLVKQYIEDKFPQLNTAEKLALMDNLLMSTANIIKYTDEDGIARIGTVREQGAGIMDLQKAIETTAYLSVDESQNDDGTTRPKIELKDDADQTGTFTLNFKVTNIGTDVEKYDVTTLVTAPDWGVVDYTDQGYGERNFMADKNLEIEHTVNGPTQVEVQPGETKDVQIVIQLDAAAVAEHMAIFTNGFYVEGFVELRNVNRDKVDLNIPYLGFEGDWSKSPIFDHKSFYDYGNKENSESIFPHQLASNVGLGGVAYVGTSIFDDYANGFYVDYDRLVISPNDDAYFDSVDYFALGQLRNARTLKLKLKDQAGQVLQEQSLEHAWKSHYDDYQGGNVAYTLNPLSTFKSVKFDDYEDGVYELEFSANIGYKNSQDDILSYQIYVDREAPKVTKMLVEDDTMKIEIKDNNFLSSSQVLVVEHTDEGTVVKDVVKEIFTSYGDVDTHTYEVNNVSELIGKYDLYIYALDAGYNDCAYTISPENVFVPSDETWVMNVGDSRFIDAQSGEFIDVKFTSEDDSIATVSDLGRVEAVSAGTTAIAVSDATGDYKIHVTVVEQTGLLFDEPSYEVGRNESVAPTLAYKGEAVALDDENLKLDYDPEMLNVDGKTVKGLKPGIHVLNATYTIMEDDGTGDALVENTHVAAVSIKVVDTDSAILSLLVSNPENYSVDEYTQASIDAYLAAVEAGKTVLNNPASTQKEIDEAVSAINAAKASMAPHIKGIEDSYKMKKGGSIVVTPNVAGTWTYDQSMVSIVQEGSGYKITALKAGTTQITFTDTHGNTKTSSLEIAKDSDDNKPTLPDEDGKGNGNGENNSGNGNNNGGNTNNGKTPGTGIQSESGQGFILIIAASVAIILVLVARRRKEQE